MPLIKCINGHTGCAAAERYLERDGRAIGHDFINLECMELDDGSTMGWAAEMDELRSLYRNGESYRGRPAITYRHYIVSPDPADGINLARLRELAVTWAKKHFGEYQVAIVYHDDNEHRIPHAHVIVNNTNVETGGRLHIPNPKDLNRDLQQMARERGLGYLADKHYLYDKQAKGGSRKTTQREFKGRAERKIEREGGYSWVADIRERARTARALSHDEASYRELLGILGIELSLNSPNARRRDYLYALADHPSRKVGGEKLGWPYGKSAMESKWFGLSALRREEIHLLAENAILVKDVYELRRLARTVEALEKLNFTSIADADWTIMRLEHDAAQSANPQNRASIEQRLVMARQARQFAAEHRLLPAKEPRPSRIPTGTTKSSMTYGESSSHSSSGSHEHTIERSRSDWER